MVKAEEKKKEAAPKKPKLTKTEVEGKKTSAKIQESPPQQEKNKEIANKEGASADSQKEPSKKGSDSSYIPKKKFEEAEGSLAPGGGGNPRFRSRRRILDTRKISIDYKKSAVLERFISKTGKILPRRVTGANALVQRRIAREVKRARHIGLLPYSDR